MRKLLSILLLVCYLPSSVGLVVSQHFCQGQLEKIAVYKQVNSCCCGAEKQMKHSAEKDNCCSNKTSYYKLGSDQQKVNSISLCFSTKKIAAPFINRKCGSPASAILCSSSSKNTSSFFYRKRNKPLLQNQPPAYDFTCCWKTDCLVAC
jgi:hypothetical protein